MNKDVVNNEETTPGLSVIIVSYKCKPFLKVCLDSLLFTNSGQFEVIVIDNNSKDGTVEMLRESYPWVKVIANHHNAGFGKACNQGMQLAKGRYYLMLNPDTIVPENLCQSIIGFMDNNQECGAMGAMMIDANGKFLPESRRGLPNLYRSFCRFTGLTWLFPRSKWFAGYYMGHVPRDQVHEVEVLAGAFMALSARAIKKCGGFDERFFMYGEDIDLSWRLLQAGYKNIYNPNITIIHFKGESTIKDITYLHHFYGAMMLFYDIHFRDSKKKWVSTIIQQSITILKNIARAKIKLQYVFSFDKGLPVKGDYRVITGDETMTISLPGTMAQDTNIETVVVNNNVPRLRETSNYIINLSTLKPSLAIDFIKINRLFCNKVIWASPKNDTFFYPVKKSDNTIVIEANCCKSRQLT